MDLDSLAMPDPKRERQRQNREAARAAQLEAAKAQRKRQSLIRGTVGFVLIIGLFVLFAALHSSGGKKTSAGAASTTTTASSGPTTTTTVNPAVAAVQCNDTKPPANANRPTFTTAPPMTIDPAKKYTVTFETSCGKITAELDPKGAPKTVNNFVFLAQKHFFDGLTWHRVVKDFVIQGGDPQGTGSGGPGYQFEDELPKDGYKLGSLAMANSGPNTNGSQFFIVTGQNGASLPNKYSRFGMVTGGLDVAQKLESFSTGDGPPSRPLYIFTITIKVG
jgi:cyclophilin family peptidyl-prolyl cis-trans isomerase